MTFHPAPDSRANRRRMRDEVRRWLAEMRFTHFVTLTTNDPTVLVAQMRQRLRRWDARVNRKLVGPKWRARPDERVIWIAFPEKLQANPHWHLLAQVDDLHLSDPERQEASRAFSLAADREWCRIVPGGTCMVQPYRDTGAVNYVSKDMETLENFENFLFSREFSER